MKELEAQANKKNRMIMSMSMSNTIVIASSPRPRTPSPRTTAQAQSIQGQEETLNSSEYTTPTPMPIRSMTLAQLYHSSRRSRHDSPQHSKTTDIGSVSSIDPLPLFSYSRACNCNDQEKIWKEMETAISNTNADEWSFCSKSAVGSSVISSA